MKFSQCLIGFAVLILLSAVTAQLSADQRLHVLFIAVDDLRPEFGAYGGEYIHSPNLDRIAKRGVTFRRARGPAFEGAEVADSYFHDGALADMAVAALQGVAKKDQPFWLGVGFIRPHLPFVAPKKYWDLYDPAKIQLAPNPFKPKGAPEFAVLPGGELRNYHAVPAGPIPDEFARHLEGTSLVPVLRDPTRTVKTAAFSQYPRSSDGKQLMGYSMRTDRYRLTRWVLRVDPDQQVAVELYDHQTDPQENQNVASDPANAELVARLIEISRRGWRAAQR